MMESMESSRKESVYTGIGVSQGLASGRVMRIENRVWQIHKVSRHTAEKTCAIFDEVMAMCVADLAKTAKRTKERLGQEEGAIFEAHAMMLQDPELIDQVKTMITDEGVSAPYAVNEAFAGFISIFEGIEDDYLKQRAADLADVRDRLIDGLMRFDGNQNDRVGRAGQAGLVGQVGQAGQVGQDCKGDDIGQMGVIIVAEDLTPSQLATLDGMDVKGFVLEKGARTSHFTIMANAMGIPTLIQVEGIMAGVGAGVEILLDASPDKGNLAQLFISPSEETKNAFDLKMRRHDENKARLARWKDKKTLTADGRHIELSCNIGTEADLDAVIANGAEGIGLFRTEFLFIDRPTLPTEEEQFKVYKSVLERMEGKRVIIRTMDAGGDKEVGSLDLPKEENPFLGYRAIRICLEQKDLFVTQLRAILRASTYGRAAIMFPMIATLEEWHEAAAMVEDVKSQLLNEGVEVAANIELGMMVEIPSVAVQAKHFAKAVDFFSIGTNDLTQYTLAVDRGNERVSALYDTAHPAVLNLIGMTVKAAQEAGKWVGVCGESAGDPDLQRLYAAMGIEELSMSASKILASRERLAAFHLTSATGGVDRIMALGTLKNVRTELEKFVIEYSEHSENML